MLAKPLPLFAERFVEAPDVSCFVFYEYGECSNVDYVIVDDVGVGTSVRKVERREVVEHHEEHSSVGGVASEGAKN